MKNISLIKAMMLIHQADSMEYEERLKLQETRLLNLIHYVRENSPYFSELYEDIDLKSPLSTFPVTTKRDMMDNFDTWFTDSSITKDKIDEFMEDLSNVGKKFQNKYLVYTTSGSTGNPSVILYDDTAVNIASAIGVARSFARKNDMFEFIKSGRKTIALYADNGFFLGTGSVKYNLRNNPWKKDKIKTLDVNKPTSEIVEVLNDFQPNMIGSYPTALEVLAEEQEKGRLNISPVLIMTGGEKLEDDIREHLSQVFNCYVQTNYSSTEGGIMACECTEKNLHINDDWIIIEPVDKNNQPVAFGTQSDKILITNLANYICPIIRFEITDRVVIQGEKCSCGNQKPWLSIEGRTDDILIFNDEIKISPMSFYAILKEVNGIRRFQIIQDDKNSLELRIISENPEEDFQLAKSALDGYLKERGVFIEIYHSDKLPEVHPISGKFKHVIRDI